MYAHLHSPCCQDAVIPTPDTPSALPFSPSKDAGQIVELVRSLSQRQLAPLAGALSFSQHDIPGGNLHFFGVHCFIV